jgi:AraC-like DNA-binding protein
MDRIADFLYYMLMDMERGLLFLAHSHTSACRARVDKYFQGYSTLQYMDSGGVELFYGNQRWELAGPWFWPAEPGPYIRFHRAAGYVSWDHRHLAFSGPRVESWRHGGIWLEQPQPAPSGRDWAAVMDAIRHAADRKDRWGQTRAANLLESLLLDLAEARNEPAVNEPWLAYIYTVLEGGDLFPDYSALAAACRMGLSTLRRRFKQRMRISLHHYVIQYRIHAARALLAGSDLPIKAVAEKLGYTDVFFFTRQFRRYTGVTPGAFRDSRQI